MSLRLAFLLAAAAVTPALGTARAEVVVLPAEHDNTVYSANPGGSNGAGDHLFAGANSNGGRSRALLSFDIAGNLPPGSTVEMVTLRLHASRVSNTAAESTTLHRVLASWGEGWSDAAGEEGGGAPPTPGDATWFDRIYPDLAWTTEGGDFAPGPSAVQWVGDTGPYLWSSSEMRADVQAWLDAPEAAHGWLVRGEEGAVSTAKRFDSRTHPEVGQRPLLTVEYTPSGIDAGACCLPDGGCRILTPADCEAAEGTYQGDGTTCTTDPCAGVPITIVIEPTADNTLYEEGGVSNGGGEYFFSGMNAALIKRRAVLRFDLGAAVPPGAVVSAATLTLYNAFGGSAAADVTLHRGLRGWGEGSADAAGDEEVGAPAGGGDATWAHAFHPDVAWNAPGGDYVTTPSATTYVAFEAYYSWSGPGMIDDLQAWVDDPGENHGWFLLGREWFTAMTRKRWVSRESVLTDRRPKLEITYSVPPPPPVSGLPPVPVPPENPITEAKRVLGKILFWEEQLSSDGTVACGTCHRPAAGGADPRPGLHPGHDLVFGTEDDILGSPGVRRADPEGAYYPDPIFGDGVQVTARNSQNFFGALWAPRNFWDGRADGVFRDPTSGEVVIPVGGSLESQALGPILSNVEMARDGRDWDDVAAQLAAAQPLVLASDLPPDVIDAIAASPEYPALFAAAFGDESITPTRIAFAIATYERTLVADETPWDRFQEGETTALTPQQQTGADFVQNGPCAVCHGGPLFTSDTFRNIGLRPPEEDNGREGITGDPVDRGRFKVPSLRNVGLRDRLMHTGQIEDVADALDFYTMNGHPHFTENQDPNVLGGIAMSAAERAAVEDFLVHGLTDPRVANEVFPFDRPRLASEAPSTVPGPRGGAEPNGPAAFLVPLAATASPNPFAAATEIRFRLAQAEAVEVSVVAPSGQLLLRETVAAGAGDNVWRWEGISAHGTPVPRGVYFVRLRTATQTALGRLVRSAGP